MRWLFLLGGFAVVAWIFADNPTAVSIGGAVVYVIFRSMKKDPRVPHAMHLTPAVSTAAALVPLPLDEPEEVPLDEIQRAIPLQRNGLPPTEWLAGETPITADLAAETLIPEPLPRPQANVVPPMQPRLESVAVASQLAEKTWIDPRRWATLVRAYALFLMVAALSSYNATWRLVLTRWIFKPGEATGAWLQPMKLALFLLPFLASQLLTATWLVLIRARQPDENDRAYRVAREVADELRPRHRYRAVRIAVAAVAQPHLVSVLAKPFLILPRQGLAYYELRARGNAEELFRAVIAHEIGHLESWDDLLFLPSFSYVAASFALCLFGVFEVVTGRIAWSALVSQLLAVSALTVLASYVIRRREAYSDSFSVVALRSFEATTRSLEALQKEAAAARSWLTTHFDIPNRLALLARRGRPFLEMARYDLAITAFIYLNLDKSSVKEVAAGAGVVWDVTVTIDAVAHFVLLWLLLLMIGGASLARRGEAMSVRDLFVAAALCIVSRDVLAFFRMGVFSAIQIAMSTAITIMSILMSAVAFVLIMRVLNRWTIAILGRQQGDARERLVWGALWIAVAFTVPTLAYQIATAALVRRLANPGALEALGSGSTSQQMAFMLPIFLSAALLWTIEIGSAAAVAIWSWTRSRSIPDLQCPSCGLKFIPRQMPQPLVLSCFRCGKILRPDLVMELESEGAVA